MPYPHTLPRMSRTKATPSACNRKNSQYTVCVHWARESLCCVLHASDCLVADADLPNFKCHHTRGGEPCTILNARNTAIKRTSAHLHLPCCAAACTSPCSLTLVGLPAASSYFCVRLTSELNPCTGEVAGVRLGTMLMDKISSGENFVTPPILVQGYRTQESLFSTQTKLTNILDDQFLTPKQAR